VTLTGMGASFRFLNPLYVNVPVTKNWTPGWRS